MFDIMHFSCSALRMCAFEHRRYNGFPSNVTLAKLNDKVQCDVTRSKTNPNVEVFHCFPFT